MYELTTVILGLEVKRKFASLREAFKIAKSATKKTKNRVYLHKSGHNGVVFFDDGVMRRRRAGFQSFNGGLPDNDLDMRSL